MEIDRSEILMEKQGTLHEASHSSDIVRNRSRLATNLRSCGQGQCTRLHPCSCVAQGCRRLDRPTDLFRLRHQPQYFYPGTTTLPGRRIRDSAARQATTATSPGINWRTS